jgi:hypothetical protein
MPPRNLLVAIALGTLAHARASLRLHLELA